MEQGGVPRHAHGFSKRKTGASKYDMVKVKVWLGGGREHHYILSRFLVSRMLTVSRVPHGKAAKIALELKKQLVDQERLEVSQAELEATLFQVMQLRGFGQQYVEGYRQVSAFMAARQPLVLLLCGAPWTGKSSIAQQLASRLNMPNVLSTALIRDLVQAAGLSSGLHAQPLCSRPELASPAALLAAFRVECVAVRHALEGDFMKVLSDGKPLIVEGSHLDLAALLPELQQRGTVMLSPITTPLTVPPPDAPMPTQQLQHAAQQQQQQQQQPPVVALVPPGGRAAPKVQPVLHSGPSTSAAASQPSSLQQPSTAHTACDMPQQQSLHLPANRQTTHTMVPPEQAATEPRMQPAGINAHSKSDPGAADQPVTASRPAQALSGQSDSQQPSSSLPAGVAGTPALAAQPPPSSPRQQLPPLFVPVVLVVESEMQHRMIAQDRQPGSSNHSSLDPVTGAAHGVDSSATAWQPHATQDGRAEHPVLQSHVQPSGQSLGLAQQPQMLHDAQQPGEHHQGTQVPRQQQDSIRQTQILDLERQLQQARVLQEHLAGFNAKGVPIIRVQYGAFHLAVEQLHEYALRCICGA